MVVFSDVAVWLVADDGNGVVSMACVTAGVVPKAAVVVERCASVVVSSRSIVLAVVPLEVDVTIMVGVSDVCFVVGATVVGLRVGEMLVSFGGLVASVAFAVTGQVVDL